MKTISIVIPALNERDGIERAIGSIPKAELANRGYEVQILVVDNGSDDGTGETARQAGAEVVYVPSRGLELELQFKTGCPIYLYLTQRRHRFFIR
jgi:glycosyltransferase involved in cell wall biosynthesis